MEVRLVKKDSGASQYEIKGKYLSCPSKSHFILIIYAFGSCNAFFGGTCQRLFTQITFPFPYGGLMAEYQISIK